MRKISILATLVFTLTLCGCDDYYDTNNNPVTYGETYFNASISTDKACYKPGETVRFAIDGEFKGNVKVRYSHLDKVIAEESLVSDSWSWVAPAEDYKGYMVYIYETLDGKETIHQSIAVDVSSDWSRFPRYGFLSSYGKLSESIIESNINVLNRYHINGVQYYDWMYDHHRPLAGTTTQPDATWPDLMGRTNYLSTVKGYINACRNKGMKSMFYNLAFGALKGAASDGVKEEWYIFKDANHSEKDNHHLDAPFRSSIYLTNPANTEWQSYLAERHKDVYQVFDFDGYHIDQLGYRGTVYDYNGNVVELDNIYDSFITAMAQASPGKRLVMNAVSQYGQQKSIAKSEVDFLYSEVWDETKSFEQLANVITDNYAYSEGKKQTVLAAYMNYAKSSNSGFVNTPGVLLANAVIFSFGGAHLELGEHYLANEYFPNSNLQMKAEMKEALVHYYDFLVAYQNLLRDGGDFFTANADCTDGKIQIAAWPASQGSVAAIGKRFANKDVVHLINFSNANSMEWRDTNGTQKQPVLISNVEVKATAARAVSKVWIASPDIDGGVARELSFNQSGNDVTFTLPSLEYWNMVVLEY